MDCIFCKIIKNEIPSVKVYEDDRVFAFLDINPLNDGHLLVIPKAHAENIHEITEADFVAVASATHKLTAAVKMQLNGKAANQVVPHLHVHIVPRWFGDGLTICKWELVAGDMEKLKAVGEQIQEALE
jgi:histidine triad (HIT) family protein